MILRIRLIHLLIFFSVSLLTGLERDSWSQWRGEKGDGHAPEGKYPIEWSEDKNILWKTLLPGRGHSSPVYQGDHAWVTTAVETPASDKERDSRIKESKFPGAAGLHYLSKVDLFALQIDLQSGELLQEIKVFTVNQPQAIHRLNSYASPSPILEKNLLYVHFGAFGTACIHTKTSSVIWRNQEKRLWIHHENGPGSTPVCFADLLIFHLDGTDQQSVVALKKKTGEVAWQTKRSGELRENPQTQKAYATPIIASTVDGPILISTGADWVYGYEPSSGKELWKINYGILGFSNVAKPVLYQDLFIISTGFMKGELHAYRLLGHQMPSLVWKLIKGAPKKPSPIVVKDRLYVVNDGGVLTSMEVRTGKEVWRSRIEGEYSASPTLAGELLYFSNQSGLTTVIRPSNSLEIISENQLRAGGHMASFAPYKEGFLIRTDHAIYRIGTLSSK